MYSGRLAIVVDTARFSFLRDIEFIPMLFNFNLVFRTMAGESFLDTSYPGVVNFYGSLRGGFPFGFTL